MQSHMQLVLETLDEEEQLEQSQERTFSSSNRVYQVSTQADKDTFPKSRQRIKHDMAYAAYINTL